MNASTLAHLAGQGLRVVSAVVGMAAMVPIGRVTSCPTDAAEAGQEGCRGAKA